MSQQVPEFICLGVPRGGTSWLDHNLRLHPGVFLAEKEINFFSPTGDYDFYRDHGYEWYWAYFEGAPDDVVTGEVAIHYLSSDIARDRISRDYPEVRFIAMLRNPVERFNSIYELLAGRQEFVGSLRDFAEDWRGQNQLRAGLYAQHLHNWHEASPSSQFCVILQDDIKADPIGVYKRICRFVGADDSFVPDTVARRVNEPKTFRSAVVRQLYWKTAIWLSYHRVDWLRKPIKASGLPKLVEKLNKRKEYRVPLGAEDGRWLANYYRSDIEELERFLGRDLSAWEK
jgi:hypothetical protein